MAATIYKIYCLDSEITECYVGSTEDFTERRRKHKSDCYNTNGPRYNIKLYKFIRASGGMDNFIIEEIIDCDIEDRYDCELYYFKLFKASLNSIFPKRSKTQYYIDNKQHYQQYYIDNKETITEYKNQKHNCECGATYTNRHKARHIKTIKHQNYINSKL
tara:strand:+ start:548 stop:1027 length:480 start_codon:yes stop_codon:yes gene_type:complete